jgi:hypothetical protein
MNSRHRNSLVNSVRGKVAAVFGASVVFAMAALSLVAANTAAHATLPMSGPGGDTTVQTTPPPTPDTGTAKPTIKAPAFNGGGWPGNSWGHYP